MIWKSSDKPNKEMDSFKMNKTMQHQTTQQNASSQQREAGYAGKSEASGLTVKLFFLSICFPL